MDVTGLTIALVTLCINLYTVAKSIKDAPEDVKLLQEKLEGLQRILLTAESTFGDNPPETLSRLKLDISSCLSSLDSVVAIGMKRMRDRFRRMIGRMKWPLKQDETQKYIVEIERLKGNLTLELQVYQTKLSKKSFLVLSEDKRHKVLQWVHGGKCNERHVHIQSERQVGSCSWVLEAPQFEEWMKSTSLNVLLGYGIAGSGKTFLSPAVIDYLQKGADNKYAVAHLYFGHQDRAKQSAVEVFSIFTKQLLEQLPQVPTDIMDMFGKRGTEILDLETLQGILFSMPMRFEEIGRQVFVICDALDEMDEYKQRQMLLPKLYDMANIGFKVIMEKTASISQKDIVSALVTSADGICFSGREDQLDFVYDRCMQIIRKGGSSELAFRVLSWLSSSITPLRIEELTTAVSIVENAEENTLDFNSSPRREILTDICAGLITIEENTGIVRLTHYTAQEYLLRKCIIPEYLSISSGYHAAISATYLMLHQFSQGPCKSEEDYKRRIRENKFLEHAAANLTYYISFSDEKKTKDVIMKFVQNTESALSYLQAQNCHTVSNNFWWDMFPHYIMLVISTTKWLSSTY
ncbi:hypothetical protein BZA77DRAFT_296578 [Pyronema omphalodes]|nr:hypothetical protein BZA77DRAFT_296578 [Pyronema omphalodes]